MTLMEFIDLFEVEPVLAKLRLTELVYGITDQRDLSDAEWSRAVDFGEKISPTWMGHLYNQSSIIAMTVTLKRFSDDDWQEIGRISPAMAEAYHFLWDKTLHEE